mmetsp:Transcript_59628/g.141890  ORF Transcript_59628/g.141890 Transcript_59628/m.141890 type:complete len:338 (+) Transcript_59628:69-1082(+)
MSGVPTPAWLLDEFPERTWQTLQACQLRLDDNSSAGLDLEASEIGYLVDEVSDSPGQDTQALFPGASIIAIDGQQLLGLDEDTLEATFGERFAAGARLVTVKADEMRAAMTERQLSRRGPQEHIETMDIHGMVVKSMPARNRRKRAAPADAENMGDDEENGLGQEVTLPSTEEVRRFEFMDHTADVILHSWAPTMSEAWEQVCVAFFAHLTDLDKVEMTRMVEVEATGHDMLDLLYHLLDEFLFIYGSEYMICRRVQIETLDLERLTVKAFAYGEVFDRSRHSQGTEIKAITMHQMKVLTPTELTTEEGTIPRMRSDMEGGGFKEGCPYECYVLVDI